MPTTISAHSTAPGTAVAGHSGVSDVGRIAGVLTGYTEVTEHNGNSGTPLSQHSGVPGATEVKQH